MFLVINYRVQKVKISVDSHFSLGITTSTYPIDLVLTPRDNYQQCQLASILISFQPIYIYIYAEFSWSVASFSYFLTMKMG